MRCTPRYEILLVPLRMLFIVKHLLGNIWVDDPAEKQLALARKYLLLQGEIDRPRRKDAIIQTQCIQKSRALDVGLVCNWDQRYGTKSEAGRFHRREIRVVRAYWTGAGS